MKSLVFLDSFNAKIMQLNKIVESFVPSEDFDKLAGGWNALLIGPRGSGKTTYLRMLETRSLRMWNHPDADKYRKSISYTGIYVPSDIAWGSMVSSLKDNGKLDKECYKILSETAFITSVFQACINAIEDRIISNSDSSAKNYKLVTLDNSSIESIIRKIANAWKLVDVSLSFGGLKEALKLRMIDIKEIAKELEYTPNHSATDLFKLIPYSRIPLEECLDAALTFFDDAVNESDNRWALLLDEFEIAPFALQEMMLARLRSSNKKIIYKIALAPCGPHTQINLSELSPPSKDNDYKRVELWHRNKNTTLKFCQQLLNSKFNTGDSSSKSNLHYELFGRSIYSDADDEQEWNQKWNSAFIALAKKDKTFADFIEKKKIDVESLDRNNSTVRKIAPLVAFREAFLNKDGNSKAPNRVDLFYSGWESFAAISEGNPRWFIGMLNMLLLDQTHTNNKRIPTPTQYSKISEAANSFCAMLKLLAKEHNYINLASNQPVYNLLEKIGTYFHERLIKMSFAEEIPLSFVIDKKVSAEEVNALQIALNHGAIICLSDLNDVAGFKSLVDLRFRLAYLLAPVFELPLRGTKTVNLSTILNPKNSAPAPEQGVLL